MIGYTYHDNNETKLYPDSDYIDMLSFELSVPSLRDVIGYTYHDNNETMNLP